MPQRDYRAYAQTPQGKEARARAHARYVAKRRELNKHRGRPAASAIHALNNAFQIGRP